MPGGCSCKDAISSRSKVQSHLKFKGSNTTLLQRVKLNNQIRPFQVEEGVCQEGVLARMPSPQDQKVKYNPSAPGHTK